MTTKVIRYLAVCPQCGASRQVTYQPTGNRVCRTCFLKTKRTHGASETRLYGIWVTMRTRCGAVGHNHPSHAAYKHRGIRVCPEWADKFEGFRDWAFANGYADTLQIDREDNDKGYSPDNCRWVSGAENSRNRRSSKLTAEIVRGMKAEIAAGPRGTATRLAKLHGLHQVTVSEIARGLIWADVPWPDGYVAKARNDKRKTRRRPVVLES